LIFKKIVFQHKLPVMKKIIVIIMLLTMSAASFSQQTNPSPTLTKQDYLQKRRAQNTAAHFMLWGGLAAVITGGIIAINQGEDQGLGDLSTLLGGTYQRRTADNHSGEVIAIIGSVSMLGSIPLFIVAAKNGKKAMSLALKNETVSQIQKSSLVYKTVPSLTLKRLLFYSCC
jgi:hypothetical protein